MCYCRHQHLQACNAHFFRKMHLPMAFSAHMWDRSCLACTMDIAVLYLMNCLASLLDPGKQGCVMVSGLRSQENG
jgi:hypothetical protein